MALDFYRHLGIGVSVITFGVALSIFIYAVASKTVTGFHAWLLFATSFLLMLRFWWRYNELFVQNSPSRSFWHFMFDFLTAFFGMLAVLLVNDIQAWALSGIAAMLSSLVRCGMSWKEAKIRKQLRATAIGAVVMAIVLGIVYAFSASYSATNLATGTLILVVIFVVYSSRK